MWVKKSGSPSRNLNVAVPQMNLHGLQDDVQRSQWVLVRLRTDDSVQVVQDALHHIRSVDISLTNGKNANEFEYNRNLSLKFDFLKMAETDFSKIIQTDLSIQNFTLIL